MSILLLLSENEIENDLLREEFHFLSFNKTNKKFLNLFATYLFIEEGMNLSLLQEKRSKLEKQKIDILQFEKLLCKNIESLIVFDMDSTLIKQEIIDELAKSVNVFSSVSQITEEAMQGKIDFETSLKKRCEFLNGADPEEFEKIYEKIQLNVGVKEFIEVSKDFPIKKVVLSGGFNPILKKFSDEYNFNSYKANELEIKNGKFSGNLVGEIIDKEKKAYYLSYYKNKYNILNDQTIAVGDGSNDLLMIKEAFVGIGFKPKDGLKKEITNWVNFSPMYFLYFLYE